MTSFFFLFACLSTTSVPCTLVSIVRTGASTISFTPTAAARWNTTSQSSTSSASSGSFVMSPIDVLETRPAPSVARCSESSPVDRLSITEHVVARGEQGFGQVRSDEAGSAGDERAHVCVSVS